jgi:hypothetical protein
MKLVDACGHVLLISHYEGLLVNVGGTEKLDYLLFRILLRMLGTIVNFSEDDNYGDTEGAAKVQMMLRHVSGRMAAIDKDETVIRHTRAHSMNGRLEVFFVPSEIHQRADAVRFASNLVLCLALVDTNRVFPRDRLSVGPKTH